MSLMQCHCVKIDQMPSCTVPWLPFRCVIGPGRDERHAMILMVIGRRR
jgi:hypothetical protein